MQSAARFSACRRYRFALWRRWAEGPQVLFVMLNPSTADEDHDDPTIRRCIGFARSWGFAALAVGNLFAWRCSSPADLRSCPRPVGGSNDKWLLRLQASSVMTVAAWGNHGRLLGRSETVRALLPGTSDWPKGKMVCARSGSCMGTHCVYDWAVWQAIVPPSVTVSAGTATALESSSAGN